MASEVHDPSPDAVVAPQPSRRRLVPRCRYLWALIPILMGCLLVLWYFVDWPPSPIVTLNHEGPVSALAFSPDGRTLICATNKELVQWDWRDVRRKVVFQGHTDWIQSVAISPDGTTLVSAGMEGNLVLWNLIQQKRELVLQHAQPQERAVFVDPTKMATPANAISSVCFAPDGKTIATGHYYASYQHGVPGEIRLWDPTGKAPPRILTGHKTGVMGLAFSPDGSLLVSGSATGEIKIWDTRTWIARAESQNHPVIQSLSFSPDGALVAVGGGWSGSGFQFATVEPTGRNLRTSHVPVGENAAYLTRLTFSADPNILAVAGSRSGFISSSKLVVFWDLNSGKVIRTLHGSSGLMAFSPDGGTFAAVDASESNSGVRIWEVADLLGR